MTLSITIDEESASVLRELAADRGLDICEMASRLLAREIREDRPRPVYNIEELKRVCSEFEDEELALADSDIEHRLELLEAEDRA